MNFLFSRIELAKLLYQQKQIKPAIEVLNAGIDYTYQKNDALLEYLILYAKLSREAGDKGLVLHLKENINKYIDRSHANQNH